MTRQTTCSILILLCSLLLAAPLPPEAAALAKRCDALAASDGLLPNALFAAYERRIDKLHDMLANGASEEAIRKEAAWLSAQIGPYADATLEPADATATAALSMTLRPTARTGEILYLPLNYPMLERLCGGRFLSRLDVRLTAETETDAAAPVSITVEKLSPERSRLAWAHLQGATAYHLSISEATQDEQPLPNQLIGNGDYLLYGDIVDTCMHHNFWSLRAAKLFEDDTVPALVAGRWTDYIHVYRNLGKPDAFRFREAEHYVIRDPYDELVGTSSHHGLAYSMVEPSDFDHDGRMDFFVSRFYNTVPFFMHNIGEKSSALEYASPVTVNTLEKGWRYTYGDLDGDRIPDAVGARLAEGSTIRVIIQKGLGLSAEGVPRFAKKQPLDLPSIPECTCVELDSSANTVAISLDDLDGDGLLELTLLTAPAIYIYRNQGTPQAPKFAAPQRLMNADGTPFETTLYYPNFCWTDLNGDKIPDLFRRNAQMAAMAADNTPTLKPLQEMRFFRTQQELDCFGLAEFKILDLDGDGVQEYCQVGNNMTLRVAKFHDGLFSQQKLLPLGNPDAQRYGCPDKTEYHAYYSQMAIRDVDGDGRPDVLLNNEHNWRFGYFSLYRNLGNDTFGPEEKLAPKPLAGFPVLRPSPGGQALHVDADGLLDYLAIDTDGLFSSDGGAIQFAFASTTEAPKTPGRLLFSSTFWDRKRWTSEKLWERYRLDKTLSDFFSSQHGFALAQQADGRLILQVNGQTTITQEPVPLVPGEWHDFRVEWDASGTRLIMDRTPLLAIAEAPRLAEKLHIGSQAWMAMQYAREYPGRRKYQPTDFSCPADGDYEYFSTFDAQGTRTLAMDFNSPEGCGELASRSALAYRCSPDVVTYKGAQAILAHFDDPNRTRIDMDPTLPIARMHIVPFTAAPGEPLRFQKAIPLSFADGTPFYAHTRTVATAYDWNKDGHTDIILSSENYPNDYNIGIELFLNDGNWNFTRTKDPELIRLNELLTAHHDIKLALADLFGSGEEDFFVWTDPGLRAYRRAFLRQQPADAAIAVEKILVK